MRLLTRVIPYIHEDSEWKDFFWSSLPSANENETTTIPLAQSLLNAICVSLSVIHFGRFKDSILNNSRLNLVQSVIFEILFMFDLKLFTEL